MRIGRTIFYDKATGNIIVDTGEREDYVQPTPDQYIAAYRELAERVRESFDFITLEPDELAAEFEQAETYRVNPETGELEFAYRDPNAPEPGEPVYQPPLTTQVAELKAETAALNLAIIDVWETISSGIGGV